MSTIERGYDHVSSGYANLTNIDPVKKYIQYPGALKLIGDLDNIDILDIGCGNGTFTRMLKKKSNSVTGFDPSGKQIEEALKQENTHVSGIEYRLSDHPPYQDARYDKISCVMVLTAVTKEVLEDIFRYSKDSLKEGGEMIGITLNPDFKRYGELVHNRLFRKEGGIIRIDMFDDNYNKLLSIEDIYHSKEEYVSAAEKAGFGKLEWHELEISGEGRNDKSEAFWKGYSEDPLYVGFKAY